MDPLAGVVGSGWGREAELSLPQPFRKGTMRDWGRGWGQFNLAPLCTLDFPEELGGEGRTESEVPLVHSRLGVISTGRFLKIHFTEDSPEPLFKISP